MALASRPRGWRLGGSSWSLSAAAASAAAGASSFIMRSQKARDFEGEADGERNKEGDKGEVTPAPESDLEYDSRP